MFKIVRETFRGFETVSTAGSLGGAEAIMEGISLACYGHPLNEFVVGPKGEFHASRWSTTTTDPRPAAA